MDVKFITTTAAKLSTVPVADGQIIALSDKDAYYYDMGSIRHRASSTSHLTSLPATGQTDVLYVITSSEDVGIYIWNDTSFECISSPNVDTTNTAGSTNSTDKLFLVGAKSQADAVQTYSNNKAYVLGGVVYSNDKQVSTVDHTHNYIPTSGGNVTDNKNSISILPTRIAGDTNSVLERFDTVSATKLLADSVDVGNTLQVHNDKLATIEQGAQVNTVTGVKGNAESSYRTGNINITAANIGLGNVTNESKATMFANAALTGTPTAPTAASGTNNTQIASTAFVQAAIDKKIAAADAMIYKGTIGTGGTVTSLPATHSTGWTYKVITAGTYAGVKCEIGDMIVCLTDGTTATDSHWSVIQSNIDGAVTGPSSSVDAHIPVFSGTSGKVIKDSGFTIGASVPSGAKFTDTVYTHPAYTARTSGLYKITVDATGHVSGVTAVTKADIIALGVPSTNTTYSAATSSVDGLMSAADKSKLDGIASGATKITIDSALSSTSTNPVQNKVVNSALAGKASSNHTHSTLDGLTATIAELNYCDGVTSNIQTQLNNKSSAGHTHDVSYISGVLPVSKGGTGQSNATNSANAFINALSTGDSVPNDNDYFISQYVNGGTTTTTYHRRPISALWNYIKSKADSIYATSSHTHNYAGSSSAGGAATSALKLSNTSVIGSATQPVYFNASGVPVACTYTLGKSVPSNAVFTDTTYSTFVKSGSGAKAGLVPAPSTTAGTTKYLREDGTWQVPPDTNTTYSAATTSASGLMTAAMVTKLNSIATGANAYTHPSYSAKTSGLYKVTVDASGHVSAATAVTKADITALGIPGSDTDTHYTSHLFVGASGGNANATTATSNPYLLCVDNTTNRNSIQLKAGSNMSISAVNGVVTFTATNTTYSAATSGANGLMSSADKAKLDGIASGANAYTHPTSGVTAGTYRSVTVNAAGHVTAGSNPTVTVAQGGTGATTAAAARTNLGLGSASTYGATSSVGSGNNGLITSAAIYSAFIGTGVNQLRMNDLITKDSKRLLSIDSGSYTDSSTRAVISYSFAILKNGQDQKGIAILQMYKTVGNDGDKVGYFQFPLTFANLNYSVSMSRTFASDPIEIGGSLGHIREKASTYLYITMNGTGSGHATGHYGESDKGLMIIAVGEVAY